jgi:hypothetical protein
VPALDNCEPQIIRALDKDGWLVIDHPLTIRNALGRNHVYADLRLRQTNTGQQIIVVEVKCFPDARSVLEEFYHAIGQYQVYRNALELNQMDVPLYLAVPLPVYADFFQRTLIQKTLGEVKVKLLVVDLENEVIVQWVN